MDYSKLGQIAISEQNPVGEDVKYDDDYEKVESEIAKLNSPTASSETDWELVIKLCSSILETKSKNLLIAVYLAYALFKTQGINGLCDGVKIVSDMVGLYWETLYPPLRRIKGRVNAISWMLDTLSKELENTDAIEVEANTKDDVIANLKKLDDFLNDHIENAPLFHTLINILDMKLVPKSKEIEKTVKETKKEAPEEKTQEQHKETKITEENYVIKGDTAQDFKQMVSQLNVLTGSMIESHDYRSELFTINRAFAWLDIEDLPASQNKTTLLPPPDSQEIDILHKLYKDKEYESLLWAAESRISTYLFWLDLHFYVAQALKGLGFDNAAQTVLEQTHYFIKKLPNVQNLSFSDKTPFANKDTKKWLNSLKKEQIVTKEIPATESVKVECTPQGLDKLSELMRQSASVEEEVRYNIQICHCLAQNTHNEVLIKAFTQKLLSRINEYNIVKWSPTMALEAYNACVKCLKNSESENSETLQTLYERIALLQPTLLDEIEG